MRLSRRERAERKRKRRNLLMGSVLAGLMVFSVFAFAVMNQGFVPRNVIEFGGYEFEARQVQGGVLLFTDIQGQEIGFYTDPRDTSNRVSVNPEIRGVLGGASAIAFSSKPASAAGQGDLDQAFHELLVRDLQAFSNKNVVRGQTEEDVFMDYDLINCSDASSDMPVVVLGDPVLGEDSISVIDGFDYCFNLNAEGQEIIMLRDYLILLSHGVLQ